MVADTAFVYESSENLKQRLILIGVVVCLILIGIGISALNLGIYTPKELKTLHHHVAEEIWNLSPIGLFYVSFVGGLFFVPDGLEVMFFLSLTKGYSGWMAILLILLGFIPSQALNYVMGYKLGPWLIHLISKKKLYESKRWVNKYGSYAVFFCNLLPLPSPALTFVLGIARYNIPRLFTLMILGETLKFIIIYALYTGGLYII